ncbi:MAG: VWA domain-containing protein [Deltaproteobacteria bacterium]|nr:VWA domain-containing protein [Deltaproteobacteria bacterium]
MDPSGSDINGNGVIGERNTDAKRSIFAPANTDPGDSILAAEVAAAREIVRGLDPRSTRVSLIAFAGEPPGAGGGAFGRTPQPPAVTLEPLTSEFERIDAALDELLASDPLGSTHMAAGVDQATIELTGLSGARSTPHPDRARVVFFFTDGQPTLPHGPGFEADNVRSVLRAADRAQRAGIRIHSFAIGAEALEGPLAVVELARRTGGQFMPIRRPGDLAHAVEEISVADISEIRLRHRTTGEAARHLLRKSDGAWAGLVQLQPGENEIAVTARASEGSEATQVIRIHFRREAPDPEIPQRFFERRNRLFELCLSQLKQVNIRLERERNAKVRRELRLEIERERERARRRAGAQRKRLEISITEAEDPAL